MKSKASASPALCDHFTGSFTGQCHAGVIYDSVRDQDRRDQMARFPCDRRHNAFTTCDRASFTPAEKVRRRIDASAKNFGRAIIYTPPKNSGLEQVRGILVGCSDDRGTAYIRTRATRKRKRVISAPVEQCHFARRKKGQVADGDEAETTTKGELPLFDLREVPTTGRRKARKQKVDKAA